MPIKNYTTSIAVEKTLGEIQAMLAKHGAKSVLTDYDDDGVVSHVSFRLTTPHGLMTFRLPANIDGIEKSLMESDAPRKLKCREQAARVGWRVLKDWIDAQLAIVQAGMAAMPEVFLPYAQDDMGQTLYERAVADPNQLQLSTT